MYIFNCPLIFSAMKEGDTGYIQIILLVFVHLMLLSLVLIR